MSDKLEMEAREWLVSQDWFPFTDADTDEVSTAMYKSVTDFAQKVIDERLAIAVTALEYYSAEPKCGNCEQELDGHDTATKPYRCYTQSWSNWYEFKRGNEIAREALAKIAGK